MKESKNNRPLKKKSDTQTSVNYSVSAFRENEKAESFLNLSSSSGISVSSFLLDDIELLNKDFDGKKINKELEAAKVNQQCNKEYLYLQKLTLAEDFHELV